MQLILKTRKDFESHKFMSTVKMLIVCQQRVLPVSLTENIVFDPSFTSNKDEICSSYKLHSCDGEFSRLRVTQSKAMYTFSKQLVSAVRSGYVSLSNKTLHVQAFPNDFVLCFQPESLGRTAQRDSGCWFLLFLSVLNTWYHFFYFLVIVYKVKEVLLSHFYKHYNNDTDLL